MPMSVRIAKSIQFGIMTVALAALIFLIFELTATRLTRLQSAALMLVLIGIFYVFVNSRLRKQKPRQLSDPEPGERYRKVLDAELRVLGSEQSLTLATRHNLAAVLAEQGNHAAVETEYRKVLDARLRAPGPDHPDTLATRHNLASLLAEQGNFAPAETEYRKVTHARLRVLGPDHPDTLATRQDLDAVVANSRGVWFGLAGRVTTLQAAQDAVAMYRELVATDPDRYRPELAASLSHLGGTYSQEHYPTRALPVAQEAVAIYRELVATDPYRYRAELSPRRWATSVSRCPSSPPRRRATGRARGRRYIPQAGHHQPGPLPPELAASLGYLGVALSELSRPADALPAAQEAVAIYRKLATTNPDRHRPGLAVSLSDLSVTLFKLSRPTDALPVAQEAVAIYHKLATTNPDRYRPILVWSLANLADFLTAVGQYANADAARGEAEKLRARGLVSDLEHARGVALDSDRPRPGDAGRKREARRVAPSAVRLLAAATRLLPATDRDRYAEEFGQSCGRSRTPAADAEHSWLTRPGR